jgi:hypothetical protein
MQILISNPIQGDMLMKRTTKVNFENNLTSK